MSSDSPTSARKPEKPPQWGSSPRSAIAPSIVKKTPSLRNKSSLPGIPILDACIAGDADEAENLIDAKPAVLTSTDDVGRNPAHLAAEGGHLKLVMRLYSRDANMFAAKDTYGCTPGMLAAKAGQADVVVFLINEAEHLFTSFASRDVEGYTPAHQAYVLTATVLPTLHRWAQPELLKIPLVCLPLIESLNI